MPILMVPEGPRMVPVVVCTTCSRIIDTQAVVAWDDSMQPQPPSYFHEQCAPPQRELLRHVPLATWIIWLVHNAGIELQAERIAVAALLSGNPNPLKVPEGWITPQSELQP